MYGYFDNLDKVSIDSSHKANANSANRCLAETDHGKLQL